MRISYTSPTPPSYIYIFFKLIILKITIFYKQINLIIIITYFILEIDFFIFSFMCYKEKNEN